MELISATPSPYARKVRIVLAEKQIPFTLTTEVPWDTSTSVPLYNPLEKLPILKLPDGSAIYESHYILEYLEAKHPQTPMLSSDIDKRLWARKVEVVCDGICDALVLMFFEKQREYPSQEWRERQMRKVEGGFRALSEWVAALGEEGEFLVDNKFGLADVAVGTVCGYVDVRWPDWEWRERYSKLAKYVDRLGTRESFRSTVPVPQSIKDKIV